MRKVEFLLGDWDHETFAWVVVIESTIEENFELISGYYDTFVIADFRNAKFNGTLSIDAHGNEAFGGDPAWVDVKMQKCSFLRNDEEFLNKVERDNKRGNANQEFTLNMIKSVNITKSQFQKVEMTIFGRKEEEAKSVIQESKFWDTELHVFETSLVMTNSLFVIKHKTLVFHFHWKHGAQTKIKASNITLNASTIDIENEAAVMSVPKRNALLENIQIICPIKVHPPSPETYEYTMGCTSQCVHNEYK